MFSFLLLSCDSGGGVQGGELPEDITLSVGLPEDIEVAPGETFSIAAAGSVVPYHPSLEIEYSWDKLIFPKPLDVLIAENGGSVEAALESIESYFDFYEGQVLEDIAPQADAATYVQYRVKVSVDGYLPDYNSNSNSLVPSTAAGTDTITVYIK